jgi:ligand-binding sensor domain-containing protein
MADATMWKSIFWFADNKGNVYYSDERDVFKFYEGSTATPRILRTGENGILRIYPFGDVMIIATSNKMYIVKASLNSTTGLYVYSTQEITSSL